MVTVSNDPTGVDIPPEDFDSGWLLNRIHSMASSLGYRKTREDRGTCPQTGVYYEAGYGPMYTVTVNFSRGGRAQITKETWGQLQTKLQAIRAVLEHNQVMETKLQAIREGE